MIRSLWISKTGLDAQQTQMDVIANNLANVSTNGFKRSRAVFEDLLYQTIRQPGAQSSQQTQVPSGLQIGTGVRPVAAERIHTQGNLQQTGNQLDVAIQGAGFFQGQLVTSNGMTIQPAVTIPANATSVTIGSDGIVSVTQPGVAAPVQVGSLQLASFINPAGLQSMGSNLYQETASSGTPSTSVPGTNGTGMLNQRYVETSNVNVVEEMVNMIQTQRAYEINSKSITASDQMLQKLTQI